MIIIERNKKSEESYQTATTSYPCCVSTLGDLKGAGRTTLTAAKIVF